MPCRTWSAATIGLVGLLLSQPPAVRAAPSCTAPTAACPEVSELLGRREGYGRNARGGLEGRFVVVTSEADSGPGTLREAVEVMRGPRWITFATDMTIVLTSQIRVPSDVTIDGRGRNVVLNDYGFGIYNSQNVIVTNLTIDGRFQTFSQAINIANFSRNVWIDHVDLSRFKDRLVDVKNGSTDVTLSWIKFHNHNKVMLLNNLTSKDLFANFDRDSTARVTLDHSWFVDTVQRNPRAQVGTFHIYDNLLENWDFYGMSFSLEAKATVEGNMFVNSTDRPCREPPSFQTVEGLDRTYCGNIPQAADMAVLPNGSSDEAAYRARQAEFGYTRDYRAFLKVRDNIFLDGRSVPIGDYRPDQVPPPPYCYAYEKPDAALAERIRLGAGPKPPTPPARQTCPSPEVTAAAVAAPVASGWRLLGRNLAAVEGSTEAPQFSVREVEGAAGRHGITRTTPQDMMGSWALEVDFRPLGARNLAVVLFDPAAPRARTTAVCTPDAGSTSGTRSVAILAAHRLDDGFYRCRVEGRPAAGAGAQVRVDLVTADGADLTPVGRADEGVALRNIRVVPLRP